MASSRVSKLNILMVLADYRLMSAEQLAIYFQVSKAAIWKHIRKMIKEGVIKMFRKELGQSRGRPEEMYSLTEDGVNALRENNILCVDIDNRAILADNLEAEKHQIMQNWFRLHLVHADRCGKIILEDIPSNSSIYWVENKYSRKYLPISFTSPDEKDISFIPDLVFRSYDADSDKSLLYFVEIDRGTEPQWSPSKDNAGHITGKILNYLYYWDIEEYKQYEDVWGCYFNGFRLLFVTNNTKRCAGICETVSRLGSYSGAVWVTDINAVFQYGIAGDIWYPGGDTNCNLTSFFGKYGFECPIPGVKFNS